MTASSYIVTNHHDTLGDVIDVSLNPTLIAPEIVTGTADDAYGSINIKLSTDSQDQIDHTLRTEMTRSRQYSRIVLKRKEKPLDRRFLKKSIRYTGYYQQRADKESSESESEDSKITVVPKDSYAPKNSKIGNHDTPENFKIDVPVVDPSISKVTTSNVMGLIQSVESLSSFFDIPTESSNGSPELQSLSCDHSQQTTTSEVSSMGSSSGSTNGSHELQSLSCDQQVTTSEVSSGYESMDSPTIVDNTKPPLSGGSRIKARKRTKPIPRPRQHRPTPGIGTQQDSFQAERKQLLEGQTVTTTFNPQLMIMCAAGIGCFGNDGGLLTADNSKVTVNIPEGSIPLAAHPYIVQYKVCTDYRPSAPPTHSASPLVHVKCSNTTFTHPITIMIPHHIDNPDPSSCVVLATKQDLTTQSSVEFTAFPVTKATETVAEATSDMTCVLKGDHVSILTTSLQDFQWFMLTVNNEVIVRQCRVLVFHSRPKHGNFIIKISIVEDFTDAIQVSNPMVDMVTDVY